jgi:hypothetical protein
MPFMQEWTDFFGVEFEVHHDINIIKDPLGCLEEIHSICDCVAHFYSWMAHVGIWIIEGIVFVAKGQ